MPYAKKEDKAAQMRDYRDRLKRQSIEKFIKQTTEAASEEADKLILECEVLTLRNLLNAIFDPRLGDITCAELKPKIDKILNSLPTMLSEKRADVISRFKKKVVEKIPELEAHYDKTFEQIFREAQAKIPQAELEKRLEKAAAELTVPILEIPIPFSNHGVV